MKKSEKIEYLDFFCDFCKKPQYVVVKQEQFVFLVLTRFVSGYLTNHQRVVDFIQLDVWRNFSLKIIFKNRLFQQKAGCFRGSLVFMVYPANHIKSEDNFQPFRPKNQSKKSFFSFSAKYLLKQYVSKSAFSTKSRVFWGLYRYSWGSLATYTLIGHDF